MSTYAFDTTNMSTAQIDAKRKAAIVDVLTRAAASGARLSPTGGTVQGSLTVSEIRAALAVRYQEASRLVHDLVADETVVVVTGGDGVQQTFTIA